MKHGEQLAPLIETGARGGGARPPGPHRDRASASAPARSPGCGSAWSPPAPSATSSSCPSTASAPSTCSPSRRSTTGAVDGEFVVATDARRKEVYLATYDVDGRRLTGPLVDKPAALATDGAGRRGGADPLPGGLPARGRPDAARAPAGWLARSPRSGPSCSTPSRSTCAAPTSMAAARPEAGLVIRVATAADADAIVRLEAECLGPDAWSRALVEPGSAARCRPCTTWSSRTTTRSSAYAAASIVGRHRRAAADRRRSRPRRRRGHATALLRGGGRAGRAGRADRLLLEVREANDGALAFYAASGFVEVDRRPRYYRDGSTAIVLRRPPR